MEVQRQHGQALGQAPGRVVALQVRQFVCQQGTLLHRRQVLHPGRQQQAAARQQHGARESLDQTQLRQGLQCQGAAQAIGQAWQARARARVQARLPAHPASQGPGLAPQAQGDGHATQEPGQHQHGHERAGHPPRCRGRSEGSFNGARLVRRCRRGALPGQDSWQAGFAWQGRAQRHGGIGASVRRRDDGNGLRGERCRRAGPLAQHRQDRRGGGQHRRHQRAKQRAAPGQFAPAGMAQRAQALQGPGQRQQHGGMQRQGQQPRQHGIEGVHGRPRPLAGRSASSACTLSRSPGATSLSLTRWASKAWGSPLNRFWMRSPTMLRRTWDSLTVGL